MAHSMERVKLLMLSLAILTCRAADRYSSDQLVKQSTLILLESKQLSHSLTGVE